MGILDFVKKLLPRFERSTVSEDLRATEKELTKMVMPSYEAAANVFRNFKLESEEVKQLQTVFAANIKTGYGGSIKNFVIDINNRLKNLHENARIVSELLDTTITDDVITAGINAPAAFVIRGASNISFLSRYMLSLLNYVYTCEATARDTEVEPGLEISKAEMKYVETNFHTFVKLFARYSMEPAEFNKLYAAIPDIVISERRAKMTLALLDQKETDPLGDTGYAGFVGSPIYSVRLAYAQWQNSRYESAKAKKQQLELRLLYLENQLKNRKDPSLANEISHLQDRIEKLDYQLAETDKELGL